MPTRVASRSFISGDQTTSEPHRRAVNSSCSPTAWTVIVASCVIIVLCVYLLGLSPKGRARTGTFHFDHRRMSMYSKIWNSMNSTVNPCENFYEYACGNFEQAYPNSEDTFDWVEKTVVDPTRRWLRESRVDSEQPRSTDKIHAAMKLCYEVRSQRRDDLQHAKDVLKEIGLRVYGPDEVLNVSLVDVLVTLSLRKHLPVTILIQPRASLLNPSSMQLFVDYVNPALVTWYTEYSSEDLPIVEELGGTHFAADVQEVNARFRVWTSQVRDRNPDHMICVEMAEHTPHISVYEWTDMISKHLTYGLQPWEVIYVHRFPGLQLTDKLVDEYRNNTRPAMNWITMVIHYYLMWASSYRLQRMSVWSNSKCTEYLWTVAPFALQALYAQEHVSVNQVEVAKHMFRQMSYAFRHKLKWMTNSSRTEALERFHSLIPIMGVPDDFYSPLRMDKHYSYLPKFKAPFVVSILLALEAKANFELFNFMVTRFGKWADASRWKSPFVLEAAETRGLYISSNAFYLSYYMGIFIPSPIMAMPFMDEDMAVISYAGLGHSIAHEAMHAYDMGHIDERINGMKGAWGYQVNGGFSQRVDCITRLYDGLVVEPRKNYTRSTLYENMADIAGMELTLAAMQNDSCYRPDVRPMLVGNATQQQLFFIAYCHQYCSSDASLKAYKIAGHPRNDHRCNIVLSVTPEFREAFRCPVPQTEQCHYLT